MSWNLGSMLNPHTRRKTWNIHIFRALWSCGTVGPIYDRSCILHGKPLATLLPWWLPLAPPAEPQEYSCTTQELRRSAWVLYVYLSEWASWPLGMWSWIYRGLWCGIGTAVSRAAMWEDTEQLQPQSKVCRTALLFRGGNIRPELPILAHLAAFNWQMLPHSDRGQQNSNVSWGWIWWPTDDAIIQ